MTRKRLTKASENNDEDSTDRGSVTRSTTRPSTSQPSRSMCSRCWSVTKYLLLLCLLPPFLNYAALQKEGQVLQPPGALYDIGFGQKLYLGCMGEGFPTVILDAPTGMSSDVWALVQPELAKLTKVCVYDRAGLGFSDRPFNNYSTDSETDGEIDDSEKIKKLTERWQKFTVESMADDLYRLLSQSSHQEKPLVMVGSEMGALVARFYTQLYESEVSDLVLIDPLVEDIFDQDAGVWSQFWFGHLLPSFQTMQVCAAAGITRIALILGVAEQPITADNIPEDVIMRQKYLLSHPRHLSSVVDEHHFINDTFEQIQLVKRMKSFPTNVSVTVLTGNYYDQQLPSSLNKAWAKSQQQLISHYHPGSNHIVVNGADHHMLYRKPQSVLDPIRRIVRLRRQQRQNVKSFSS